MYSPEVLEHFQNPRNIGEVIDADASAEIENPACGDVLRITLRVAQGRVVEARFKAKGCVASIACGSALMELISARSLGECANLRPEDVMAALGGLPPGSNHAAHLAVGALALALSRLKTNEGSL
jgi:nitrogen fixation NifU-like protein